MKFSLIAAIAVLALAQGIFAQDAPTSDLERLSQYFEDMKNKMVEDLTAIVKNQDVPQKATEFMQAKTAELQPMLTQLQEQLSSFVATAEEKVKPLATSVQGDAQAKIAEFQTQIQAMVATLMEQTKAITN